MPRGYKEEQIKAAHKKRVMAACVCIFLLIPLTASAGIILFDDRKYMLVSTLLLFYTILPFFMIFEKRRPKAREIVLLAMLTALIVVVQGLGSYLGIRAGSAVIILVGISLGAESGFFVGALGRFVLNFFLGHGPWTPWQMFCWGLMGFLAGLAFHQPELEKRKSRDFKIVMGPVLCVIFCELAGYLSYLWFPGGDTSFWGWRLYAFGALGLMLGCIVQRKSLPVDDMTLAIFTFFVIFIVYGGIMNLASLIMSAGIEGGNELSAASLKLLYISGAPFDAAHALTAAVFNFAVGEKMIQKLERIKIKYGIVSG